MYKAEFSTFDEALADILDSGTSRDTVEYDKETGIYTTFSDGGLHGDNFYWTYEDGIDEAAGPSFDDISRLMDPYVIPTPYWVRHEFEDSVKAFEAGEYESFGLDFHIVDEILKEGTEAYDMDDPTVGYVYTVHTY